MVDGSSLSLYFVVTNNKNNEKLVTARWVLNFTNFPIFPGKIPFLQNEDIYSEYMKMSRGKYKIILLR